MEKILDGMTDREYADGEVINRTVVVEEAHQFIPEPAGLGFGTPGREEAYKLGTLMMQIRKYGLSVVLISQRTAVVGKSALSQCENIIAFRSVDKTGLDYLEGIMGSEAVRLLPRLEQGQAIVAGPAFNSDEPVAIQVVLPESANTPT
jgi:DNA helicase HerA-like ATPase